MAMFGHFGRNLTETPRNNGTISDSEFHVFVRDVTPFLYLHGSFSVLIYCESTFLQTRQLEFSRRGT